MDLDAEFMKPEGGPAFERLMLKVCGVRYHTTFSLFGRNGQEQYGIDLYTSGFRICVQCKNYTNVKELRKNMEHDFLSAVEHFQGRMEKYVLATTLKRDTVSQELADRLLYSLPAELKEHLQFEVLFWDEISQYIKHNRSFLANESIFTPSEYDRECPDPMAQLWWMGTSQELVKKLAQNKKNSMADTSARRFGIQSLRTLRVGYLPEQKCAPEWIDQMEVMPDYYSRIQWLDDLRPVCLGPLFVCTQERGIFFLISDWKHGLTESLNQYAVSVMDGVSGFGNQGFGWVEIKLENYRHLCDQHSGTVIGVDEKWDDVQLLIKCVERWKDLKQKGQLIFHINGELTSYEQWAELEGRARHYIQNLRSVFGQLPISLLTSCQPFKHTDLLTVSDNQVDFPTHERPADWLRMNPERLRNVLCNFRVDLTELFRWGPALSCWPDVMEKIFLETDAYDGIEILFDERNFYFEMCAVALYRLYQQDERWLQALEDCLGRCDGHVARMFHYLLDPDEGEPERVDDVIYTLLNQQHAEFLGDVGRTMELLNGRLSLADLARSKNGSESIKQIGSILLPENDQYTDETIRYFRGLIRPYI